jgi:predicted GNAT family acetyltransferase
MKVMHEEGRFYISTPGGDSELLYKVDGKVVSMYHTFVPDSERGKGIAAELATAAMKWARKSGLRVRPDCSYVRDFARKHGEFSDIVD